MNEQHRREVVRQIAERGVPNDVDLWPVIRAQIDPSEQPRFASAHRTIVGTRVRRSLVGFGVAAALALVVGVSSPLWNQPQPASAQAVLDRAEAAASDASTVVTTYHLQMTRSVPAKGNATIATEMWWGGKDRQRSDQQTRNGGGAPPLTQEVIVNGAQTWIISSRKGQDQIVHTTGTTWTDPVNDPTRQASLADVLTQYNDPRDCLTATQQGEATVTNRATYVIVLQPAPAGCPPPTGTPGATIAKERPNVAGQPNSPDNRVGQITIWVDEQTFLPLKTEVMNATGVVMDRSEVTSVEYNVSIPDAVFAYTPPAGATVFNFTGGSGADVKRILNQSGGSTTGTK